MQRGGRVRIRRSLCQEVRDAHQVGQAVTSRPYDEFIEDLLVERIVRMHDPDTRDARSPDPACSQIAGAGKIDDKHRGRRGGEFPQQPANLNEHRFAARHHVAAHAQLGQRVVTGTRLRRASLDEKEHVDGPTSILQEWHDSAEPGVWTADEVRCVKGCKRDSHFRCISGAHLSDCIPSRVSRSLRPSSARSSQSGAMSGPYDPDSFLSRELRPEARLILCCARTQVGPEMVGVIHTLSKLPLDWEFLCASADKHRLTQLLFRNLSAISPESMPAGIRARLRHQFHSNAGSNLRLARTQIGLQQRFSAEAIPVIPFKGSILACCTYGKLALRQYYDIDLLIRSQDVEKSGHLLAREGYVCDEVFDGEARYKHVHDPVEVDLHWGFTPRYFHLAVDFDELYARARRESLLGQPVITFSAEDFLEILCVQVVKDCWERRQQLEHLSKVCDIAEHLRANPQIEWPRVFAECTTKGPTADTPLRSCPGTRIAPSGAALRGSERS